MRKERKIVLEVIEDGRVNNRRLAEYFADKFKGQYREAVEE